MTTRLRLEIYFSIASHNMGDTFNSAEINTQNGNLPETTYQIEGGSFHFLSTDKALVWRLEAKYMAVLNEGEELAFIDKKEL